MTLEKAIIRLDYLRFLNKRKEDSETFKAIQLGIEALKRVKAVRHEPGTVCDFPLPGETEE